MDYPLEMDATQPTLSMVKDACEAPLISIAMPVWNCESTIGLAVTSILRQTYGDWELIVIDDGSTDGTLDVLHSFRDPRLKIMIDGQHKGLPDRLNEAIAISRGTYYARMDGDDISYPERLERQLDYMRRHPEVDLIGAPMLVFRGNGRALGKRCAPGRGGNVKYTLLRSIALGHPTFFGKLEWFQRHGYDIWPYNFQDQCLLLRSFKDSRFVVMPDILLGYREEPLRVAKQFRYRMSYVHSFRRLSRTLGCWPASVLVASQAAKLGLDCFAICTGLELALLRHRFRPLSQGERTNWARVWDEVTAAAPEFPIPLSPGGP